ncbi:hypothetical protein C5167_026701 [Papaver somniferum]|nr:hypothetical protein C5167_026701 [Papaver somniferum]
MIEDVVKIWVNIFRGFTLPDAPRFAPIFGGRLKEEVRFEYQEVTMPSALAPETSSFCQWRSCGRVFDPHLPRNYRNMVATMKFIPRPVAKIVAECMNNYLLFDHFLQVLIVPTEKVHPKL